jgi:hypothetical protein
MIDGIAHLPGQGDGLEGADHPVDGAKKPEEGADGRHHRQRVGLEEVVSRISRLATSPAMVETSAWVASL